MIVCREAMVLIENSRAWLKASYNSYKDKEVGDIFRWFSPCAFSLAQSGEYLYKYLLCTAGIEPPMTHDHVMLTELCGHYGIKLARDLSKVSTTIKRLESKARYVDSFRFNEDDYRVAFKIIQTYMEDNRTLFYNEVRSMFKDKLPSSIDDITESILYANLDNLPVVELKPCIDLGTVRRRY